MANDSVKIIIEAVDKASGVINNINSSFNSLDKEQAKSTASALKLSAGLTVAGAVIGAVVNYTKQAIKESVEYTKAIDDMSRSVGVNREETSRLVQVAESLGIEQKNLASAMQYARKNGIDVSIDGLKNLANEYNNLKNPVDKLYFLQKRFGSASAEMGKMLSVGADGLEKQTAAVKESLVVTDEAYQATQNYIQTQEKLKDVQESLNYSVGRVAMEGWTQVLLGINVLLNGYTENVEDATTATRGFTYVNNYFGKGLQDFEDWLKETSEAVDDTGRTYITNIEKMSSSMRSYNSTLMDLKTQQQDEINKIAELEEGYWSYHDAGRAVWDDLQSIENQLRVYRPALDESGEGLRNLKEKHAELIDELSGYEQVWGQDSKAIKEHKEKLSELTRAIQDNAEKHRIATYQILLDNMQQALSVGGLSEEEAVILQRMGEAWGIYEEGVANNLALAIEHAGEWGDEINRIPTAKTFTYTLVGNITESFKRAMELSEGWDSSRIATYGGPGGASGLDFIVPPGYPNDSYPIRVQSGEHVKVTPKNQLQQGGGSGGGISRADMLYLGKIIAGEIQKALG